MGSAIAPPAGPAAKRISVQFTAHNLQICKRFIRVHKTPMQHFNDFFRNADSDHVVSSSSGSEQSHAKYISCILEVVASR